MLLPMKEVPKKINILVKKQVLFTYDVVTLLSRPLLQSIV